MDKRTELIITEINKLLQIGNGLVQYGKSNGSDTADEKVQELTKWTNLSGELIFKLYPNKSSQYNSHFQHYRAKMEMTRLHSNNYQPLLELMGVLEAIKYELESGLINKLKTLIQADIFSDFLEMGEHLLKEGYKDASAVIIGSVLEDTLRKIAQENNIEILNDKGKFLTMDPLNIAIEKIGIYNQLVKKQITSWADLRNNAAHGRFSEYDDKQVAMMLQFVQTFSADYLK
ncbi:MAG: hypothetical protein H0U95_03225 [Bacteroidetes bacterium]|nr:hypothetical protein [Bacteroidota bacterium]